MTDFSRISIGDTRHKRLLMNSCYAYTSHNTIYGCTTNLRIVFTKHCVKLCFDDIVNLLNHENIHMLLDSMDMDLQSRRYDKLEKLDNILYETGR